MTAKTPIKTRPRSSINENTISKHSIARGKQHGIIPRAVMDVFNQLKKSRHLDDYRVTVTYLEIYNEELKDLLIT